MTKSKQSAAAQPSVDEMCYCARCGVSFLWTIEEKSRARQQSVETAAHDTAAHPLQPPAHCPGCRRLLQAAGRERGLVKWYNGRKRFGFIIRSSGDELFAHGSALKGVHSLQPGDLVEFSTQRTEKGEAAQEVVLLQRGEEGQNERGLR
ncbi:MAG: cold shock domain-containing protein [Caldilineaceae bacterium]